jgi:hypothetical protein
VIGLQVSVVRRERRARRGSRRHGAFVRHLLFVWVGFEVTGVRHALVEPLLDVGPERNDQPSGGAAPGVQLPLRIQ